MTKTFVFALVVGLGGVAAACPHHDEGNAPKTVKTEKPKAEKAAPAKTDTAKSDAKAPAKADDKKPVEKKPA